MSPSNVAPAIITLTTDFGVSDPYVAQMKGVILGLSPSARLVDVTHEVRPQAVRQAVYLTQAAWPAFPEHSVHVAVVDPGVGSERRALLIVTPHGRYIGPDNGVLSSALPEATREHAERDGSAVGLPAGHRAFLLAERRYMREPVSATFHGRDVFAPAAAHLTLGVAPEAFGEPVTSMLAYPPLRAHRDAGGSLSGEVMHIDRFGNVVMDVRREDLPDGVLIVEIAGDRVPGPVLTYSDATGLTALVESSGYLEVALPNGSAADALGVDIGAPVHVRVAG